MVERAVEEVMAGPIGHAANAHLRHVATQTELLQQLLAQAEVDPLQLAASDKEIQPGVQVNFPVDGARRARIKRTPDGPNVATVLAAGSLIFDANQNRIGGTIVNKGANGLTLYLSDSARAGAGTVWLSANGGAWDFLVGHLLWCGSVFGVPDTGNLAIAGLEL